MRTSNDRLARLISDGVRLSATFQELMDRLSASDVIAHVEFDANPAPGLDGRLTFVTSVPGARYVVIRVNQLAAEVRQIAIIGHELQHAVEVAEAPTIIDQQSFAREFGRIGYRTSMLSVPFRYHTFDTAAAIRTGNQILRELTAASAY